MTKYYSLEADWESLKNEVGNFTGSRSGYNIWTEITDLFYKIDETEQLISDYELNGSITFVVGLQLLNTQNLIKY